MRMACVIEALLSGSPFYGRELLRPQDLGDEALQHRPDALELAPVGGGELREHVTAARSELELDLSAARARGSPAHPPFLRPPVNPPHRAPWRAEGLAR